MSRPDKVTYLEELLRNRPYDLSPECVEQCTPWLGSSSQKYIRALEQRKEIEMRFEACLYEAGAAAYVLPTTKTSATPLPKEAYKDYTRRNIGSNNTLVFNMSHQPAASIPGGFGTSDGMPIGLQIAGRLWEDHIVLRIAHAFQKVTDFHTKRAPLDL